MNKREKIKFLEVKDNKVLYQIRKRQFPNHLR